MAASEPKRGSTWAPKDKAGNPRRWPSGLIRYRGKVIWPDGKRQDIGVPEKDCRTEKAADAYVARIQAQVDVGGAAALATIFAKRPAGPAPETCDEWHDRFSATRVGKVSTADADKAQWGKWISPTIGPKSIVDLTADDIEAVRDVLDAAISTWEASGKTRGQGLAYATAKNVWQILTHAMKHASTRKGDRALRVREAQGDPCIGIRPPKTGTAKRRHWLRPAEISAVLACEHEGAPLAWRHAIAIGLYLHLRPGELQELRVRDVDLQAGEVSISRAWDFQEGKAKPPKTDEGIRTVSIPRTLAPLLRVLVKGASPDTLLAPILSQTTEHDRPHIFRSMLKLAGVKRAELFEDTITHEAIDFRSVRDTGITWRFLAGERSEVVQREAGHRELSTTLRYAKEVHNRQGRFGEPFPSLPLCCLRRVSTSAKNAVKLVARVGFECSEDVDINELSDTWSASNPAETDPSSDWAACNPANLGRVDTDVDTEGAGDDDGGGRLDLPRVVALASALEAFISAGMTEHARPLARELAGLLRDAGGGGAKVVPIGAARR